MVNLKKDKEKKEAKAMNDAEVVSAESIGAVPPVNYVLPL